ncbi:Ig-like domain-containing protein [Actinoplanes sp. NPDC023936]|uniref:Ig-like domain-containing protein n=1 Tax=Actinoplanes sp. NPDC023936 TaxID=3154910 RepID=UPI0033EEC8C5
MTYSRAGAVAALVTSLLLAGASPASAEEVPDDTKPIVTSTGVVAGQFLGTFQRVAPVFSDNVGVDRLNLLINGELQHSYKISPGIWSLPLQPDTKFNGREVDLTVEAVDAAGNSGTAMTRVRVDTVAPEAEFTPRNGTALPSAVVTIKATEVSPDVVTIKASNGAQATSAPWNLTWDPRAEVNTESGLTLWVYDRAGNYAEYVRRHYIDATGPAITVGSLPALVGTGQTYLYARTGEVTGTDRFEWWIDGVRRSTQNGYQHDFGTRSRVATVTIKAWDRFGNASSLTRKVTVDATGPVVTWISPKSGVLLRGKTVPTSIRAVDAHTESEALLGNNASGYLVCKPICSSKALLVEGKQNLVWYVYDRFGNATTVRRPVIVDNTKASLKVTKAPKNKAKVKGTVKITASASDRNGVAKVQLLVNGKVVATDAKAAYKFSLNTKKYGKKIKVQLRAYDKAGNVTTTSTRTWYRR